MLDQHGQLLRAAVGFATCSMPFYDRALWALRTGLDSWPGVGHVAVGMHRQGYDLQLTQYADRGWRATERAWEGAAEDWRRIGRRNAARTNRGTWWPTTRQ